VVCHRDIFKSVRFILRESSNNSYLKIRIIFDNVRNGLNLKTVFRKDFDVIQNLFSEISNPRKK